MSNIEIDERGREQVPAWYGIAITTNKEKLIRSRIQALAKTDQWKDQIFDCILPSFIETNDKGKEVEKLAYTQTGYVHMILNSDTWNALELLRGIGFRAILPAGNATPIPEHEMERIFKMIGRDETKNSAKNTSLVVGDMVEIHSPDDVFHQQTGKVVELFPEENEALITLDLFASETNVRIALNKLKNYE